MLTTLRTAEEVRALDEINPAGLPKPDPRMLDIAKKIIEQQASPFDPSEFTDRYEEALRALIEEKKKCLPVRPATEPEPDTNVVDLMEALRKSLATGERTPPAASTRAAPAVAQRAPRASAKPKNAAN